STSYFYRRHAGSTSARLPVSSVEALLQAGAAYALPQGEIAQAAAGHRRSLAVALRFGRAVEAIKARDLPAALRWLGASPAVWRQMARSVKEGVSRRLRGVGQKQSQASAPPSAAQLLASGLAG
ncbi:MAG TPA: hypothetical protein VN222_09175, partial [Novosphingobium sp.]|nr:hypothetical protein [Novosphingobium sp.]